MADMMQPLQMTANMPLPPALLNFDGQLLALTDSQRDHVAQMPTQPTNNGQADIPTQGAPGVDSDPYQNFPQEEPMDVDPNQAFIADLSSFYRL